VNDKAMDTPIHVAILTISDRASQGIYKDLSSPALIKLITQKADAIVMATAVLPDEQNLISACLMNWADNDKVDLILTTGGTGFAPRDVTPEATLAILDKLAPGLAEVMRLEASKITPHAMLSRAVTGIRGRTLIINLPGSPKGAVENLSFILTVIPHAIELLREDSSSEAGHHHASDKREK
jgi:molybdopterin adenylyltransferase